MLRKVVTKAGWCYVVVVRLCLPLDTDAVGIKKRGGEWFREKRTKAGTPNREQALSEENPETGERMTVKWPEENTIRIFHKCTCDLGSRKGAQCNVHAFDIPHPHHMLQSPANETHFRVQWVEPFKASCLISHLPLTLLIMRSC